MGVEEIAEDTFNDIKEIIEAFNEFERNYTVKTSGQQILKKLESEIAPYYEMSVPRGTIEVTPKGSENQRNMLIDDKKRAYILLNGKYFMILKEKN